MSSNSTPRLRCAVYTRKSSEEGLDQEFNSLDAQREACVAFIASQVGLGWKLVPDHYDDGGISGGTMERPALQRLLQDIRDKKVDVVVVYKIDRLTRSLMDFSKIVEIFDASSVSFVSVTQQFNTTTSMGRLTLNVLLSFAQFEREVTAERIRDKIAASKNKGIWMGGRVPFGYRVEDRKLVIDEQDAKTVRWIFERYLELRSVTALASELHKSGRMGGGAERLSRGKVFYLLANPIYVGKLRHRSAILPGEHLPIISTDLFDRVQAQLARQAPARRSSSNANGIHLLTSLVFDENGVRLKPTSTTSHGKRYRYYVSADFADRDQAQQRWRLPASLLEKIVLRKICELLKDQVLLATWLQRHALGASIETGFRLAQSIYDQLNDDRTGEFRRTVFGQIIARIEISASAIRFVVRPKTIVGKLLGTISDHAGPEIEEAADSHIVEMPIVIRRRGQEQRIVIDSTLAYERDDALIDLIGRAHHYLGLLTNGSAHSVVELASQLKVHPADISRILPLAFLSPAATNAILGGTQPADLTAARLSRSIDVPASWEDQRSFISR
ncbi:recombinase family protein [Mesorhizobium dulcispinae]|uniref:recombinase family protein n=1 Tax=Mesorhizobium dulcispinae TaxID=3072316 RepID=UPI002A244394|nr:recombinase family protein [Mesorhizobium sp. VK23D]MDX8522237.1 recombinase family protein [Mesorhizobium sp. VK23D]